MRSMVDSVEEEKKLNRANTSEDLSRSAYKRLRPLRLFLIVLSFGILFFTKPPWCVALGDQISVSLPHNRKTAEADGME